MSTNEKNRQKVAVAPYVDIYEKDDSILLLADMPGVDEKSASVSVENGLLIIEGDVSEIVENAYQPIRAERRADVFRRTFEISDSIDTAKITAKMKHGVLKLVLPRKEEKMPRKIEISVA